MKPERNYLEVESTLQGEDVAMGIDLASMPHLMNVLTDLYEDRELACIREYSTNAWDANREAGHDAPINVSLPGPLRPLLEIRDSGPGLSAEDIRAIYSQYGASTKRGTNDAVGMLGLGCKSALTYTDQFTLVSVKDGIKTTVSISRDDAGAGVMKILAQEPTPNASGTAVQIPARRENEFAEKARNFFRFWEPGSVLVDGAEPEGHGGLELSPTLWVLEDEPNDWIVMGNVPYPATLNIYSDRSYRFGGQAVVARVPIGGVNFTPSRESLMDTDTTEATLDSIRMDFAQYARDAVRKAVEAAPTKTEAMLAFVTANAALPGKYQVQPADASTVTYKGDPLPAFPALRHGRRIASSGHKHGLSYMEPMLNDAASAVWITDYQNDHWTGQNAAKLRAYLERHQPNVEHGARPICITQDAVAPNNDWLSAKQVLAWPTVRKWQPPRDPNAPAAKQRVTGSYNGYSPGASYVGEHPATDLPQDASLFYAEARKYEGGGLWKRLDSLGVKQAWLVLLPRTRLAKFQRDFPKAREIREFVRQHAKDKLEHMTRDELIAARYSGTRFVGLFSDLDPAEQNDPELKQVIGWAVEAGKYSGNIGTLIQKYSLTWPEQSKTNLFQVCAERYPLLDAVNYKATAKDLTLYTNAAYAARKE